MPVLDSAISVYRQIGLDETASRKLACSLALSAVQNLEEGEVAEIITGPLSRKDYDTVEKHLLNLNGDDRVVYKTTSNWLEELINRRLS